MSKSVKALGRCATAQPDAPITLAEPAAKTLGLRDSLGLWSNLGINLLLPAAASYMVLAGRPLTATMLALVLGTAIGAVPLGLGAVPGVREGLPAMVLLRGLLGRRAS